MRRVLYPGSFDPMTNGHLDLVERASKLFDEVIVGVAVNQAKDALFSIEERTAIIKECTKHLDNVQAISFSGLVVDAIVKYNVNAILRGLRAFSDFEYELQMALMNRSLNSDCETIFMMPTPLNSFVSSSIIKEAALLGGDFSNYVPRPVSFALTEKIKELKKHD
ncbi:pantetheine-phosphate adenylyltransferase [Lentisphaerota bacterium ZTH]|nr:pantetheine-phosphate adenylyltransferase [Lentisphaerota bacterium]WET06344.1 pantetheine-phosphate adenylyltransferase [Lentisphaerota bacterium ZTH]